MFSLFLLLVSCDAVSISSTGATGGEPNYITTSYPKTGVWAKKAWASSGVSTVPGHIDGKRWSQNQLGTHGEGSHSWTGNNWEKRNKFTGGSSGTSKSAARASSQTGKAETGAGLDADGATVASDKKRLYVQNRFYNDDTANTNWELAPITGKTLGLTDHHTGQLWADTESQKYNKQSGLTGDGEGIVDLTVSANNSNWIYKKGRGNYNGRSSGVNGDVSNYKSFVKGSGFASPANANGVTQFAMPIEGTKTQKLYTDGKISNFPDTEPVELIYAAQKSDDTASVKKWRPLVETSDPAVDRATKTVASQAVSHKDWIKTTYSSGELCAEAIWQGTNGCHLDCYDSCLSGDGAGETCECFDTTLLVDGTIKAGPQDCTATAETTGGSAGCGKCVCSGTNNLNR